MTTHFCALTYPRIHSVLCDAQAGEGAGGGVVEEQGGGSGWLNKWYPLFPHYRSALPKTA